MKQLFVDIETIPGQQPGLREALTAAVTAPAQYKKQDSIDAWLRENRETEGEQAWLKTSFDGGTGQVCVIGFALGDDVPSAIVVRDLSADAERTALDHFFFVVHKLGSSGMVQFVGHNLIGFDLRFLWQRAMVLGVKPPLNFPRDPRLFGEHAFDTMLAWAGVRERISMGRLCSIFGIEGKGDMDGSKVWPLVRDGRIAEVAEYCRSDVQRTRAIWRRMTFAEIAAQAA